jgi:hypothetical protein
MLTDTYPTVTRQKRFWRKVIDTCPFGILHIISPETGNKTTALVEVTMEGNTSISCTVEHTVEQHLNIAGSGVTLKLCNRNKNLYAVADVKVHPEQVSSTAPNRKLRFEIQKLACYKKNHSQQLVTWTAA